MGSGPISSLIGLTFFDLVGRYMAWGDLRMTASKLAMGLLLAEATDRFWERKLCDPWVEILEAADLANVVAIFKVKSVAPRIVSDPPWQHARMNAFVFEDAEHQHSSLDGISAVVFVDDLNCLEA